MPTAPYGPTAPSRRERSKPVATPYLDDPPYPRATRIRLGLIWALVLLLAVVTAGAYIFVKAGGFQRLSPVPMHDGFTGPAWLRQQIRYPVEEPDHKPP